MKKHGCLWWLIIGWWWVTFTLPFRILAVLIRRNKAQPEQGKPTAVQTEPQAEPPKPMKSSRNEKTHKVAGTSFRQEAIRAMGVKNPDFAKTEQALRKAGLVDECVYEYEFAPQKVELQPEPDNPHDPKAIKVVVDGTHIGYIKAGSCAHIHKLLAADRIQRITCFIGGGKSKTLYWEGNFEQYDLLEDENPFYARLTIITDPEN